MKFLGVILTAVSLWLLAASPALAQNPQTVKLCVPTSPTACAAVSATSPLPVSGSFSATLAGFTPNGNYTTLTATAATSASTSLPAGTVVAFQNLSTIDVSCVLTAGASTATTNKLIVRGGATVFYTVGSNTTTACINQTGVASNVIGLAGGAGLGTNFGGGGGGGGGGGAVTMASGAVASGAYAAGSIAAGAYVSGSILSGALASGAVVDITNLSTPVAANTATATKGILIGGQFDTTQKTLTNGQQAALSASPRGALYVATGAESLVVVGAGTAGSASGGVITVQGSASGTAIPVSGTVTATPTGTQAVSIASAQVASGAVASGAIASGAVAAGALAAGAGVDGWDLTQGAKADSVCATATASCTQIALLKFLNTSVTSAVPVNVNATATGLTGLTPGVAQTGTIIAANVDMTSLGGVAFGAMANYGTSPGAVKVPGANAFVTNFGSGTAGSAAGGVVTVQGVASMTPILSNPGTAANWGVGATGSAVPANAIYNGVLDASGGTNLLGLAGDPCQTSVKTTVPITLATAAVKVIATGVSAKKVYVCHLYLNNNAADTIAVFEATTATTCATAAVAMIGAGTSVATAGTGNNFAATGGVNMGTGANQVLVTTVNNNDVCIAQSAATQLSGTITYVTR